MKLCLALVLAIVAVDPDAMRLVAERGEAPAMFRTSLALLGSAMADLRDELGRQMGDYYAADEAAPPLYDLVTGVRLAEAAAQVVSCSAQACCLAGGGGGGEDAMRVFEASHVALLAETAAECWAARQLLPLSQVRI